MESLFFLFPLSDSRCSPSIENKGLIPECRLFTFISSMRNDVSAVMSMGKGPLGIIDQHTSQPPWRQHENDISLKKCGGYAFKLFIPVMW